MRGVERSTHSSRKRGSVLVLAVAVLAVLAVLAVSYVTVVRVERRSTDAYQKDAALQQQVNVATAYLQSLIAADLFGNRLTNAAVPRLFRNDPNLPNWPRAFEDGEFMDYPWTDVDPMSFNTTLTGARFTWDTSLPGQPPPTDALLDPSRQIPSIPQKRAFADDAWLAPIEPIDTGTIGGATDGPERDTWPQITNLRSMYRFSLSLSEQQNLPVWVRDHGRFVDLGQFLLQRPLNVPSGAYPGNPGAFLTLNSNQMGVWTDPTTDPPGRPNGPNLGVNQRIFDLQMADLQETFYWPSSAPTAPQQGQREFLPADERFWADTDGDGRPDARWQELDIFGNAFGLRWVIAARIIDNSGLANVNSHIAFGYDFNNPLNPDPRFLGDGRTPADVDLFRLIASQVHNAQAINPTTGSPEPSAHPDIIAGGNLLNYNPSPQVDSALERSWQLHLNRGVRVPDILARLRALDEDTTNSFELGRAFDFLNEWPDSFGSGAPDELYGDPNFYQNNQDQIQPLYLERFERAHIWRYFGSDPFNPFISSGLAYPLRDEIDLRAYNGYNLLRYISRLEQRLDGGFLPSSQPFYTDFINGPGLGPMRSKEWDIISESARTFANSFALLPASGQYTNQRKLERLRKDIRHLLTSISGEGPIGPIPVLNPAEDFERTYLTRKVDLNRFATAVDANGNLINDPLAHITRIRDSLQRAFEAFVWALAPLATNQPLMSPLNLIDPTTYAQLAQDPDLHYGGGAGGPARALAVMYGVPSEEEVGAAYAMHRAASLAANLPDAIDGQTAPGGGGADPTMEQPTIVRFFNQLDIDQLRSSNNLIDTWLNERNAIPLGTRFSQGDIWPDPQNPPFGLLGTGQNIGALPPEMVGEPDTGVTFVGLDRQPFFREVASLAVYSDLLEDAGGETDPNQDGVITPGDPDEQVGSIIAIELGNPWPEAISMANYEVFLPLVDNSVVLKLPDNEVILPGEFKVFYFTNPELGVNGAFDAIVNAWLATMTEDVVLLEADALEVGDPSLPVVFDPGVMDDLPAILRLNIGVDSIPLDRISPPTGGRFPRTLDEVIVFEDITGPPPEGRIATGRVVIAESVTRAVAPDADGGFPRYVIEFVDEDVNSQLDDTRFVQTVYAPEVGGVGIFEDAPNGDVDGVFITDFDADLLDTLHTLEEDPKPGDDNAPDLAAFELFVPNGPLFATSELGQVSVFAHTFIHQTQDEPLSAFEPVRDPTRWLTFSELMGLEAHYRYDAMSGSTPNPYLGVLDFSRFILGFGGDIDASLNPDIGDRLPDALAVPLATRVFDAFEALPTPDGVVRGRVNVNTAPRRILELLPMVDPRDPFTGNPLTDIGGWNPSMLMLPAQSAGDTRVDWLERYRRRDADTPGTGLNNPSNDDEPDFGGMGRTRLENYTQLGGLRSPGLDAPWSLGVLSKGEIASMALWDADGQVNSVSPAFLELGANGDPDDTIPLDIRQLANGFEAQDDPEERLALFRAISNIVSTRSDIFTAWFIIRAYDPKDIEAITIPNNVTNENEIVALMNPGNPLGLDGVSEDNPGLLPTFERRVLVIFDRSNVQRPTDRPRVLLQVELPLN